MQSPREFYIFVSFYTQSVYFSATAAAFAAAATVFRWWCSHIMWFNAVTQPHITANWQQRHWG